MKKIISILSIATILFALFAFTISASVGSVNPNYNSMLSPDTVKLGLSSDDDIVISIGNTFESTDEVIIEFPDNGYDVSIYNEPNLCSIEVNEDIEKIIFKYGPMHWMNIQGPFRKDVIRYSSLENADGYAHVKVTYCYYDNNGELQVAEVRGDYPFSNYFDFRISNFVAEYGSGNSWITSVEVGIYYDFYATYVSFTDALSEDYGIIMGDRIQQDITPELVNPNILEWLAASVSSFMQVEIFPDITISTLIFVMVAIPLCITFLKFFAGG